MNLENSLTMLHSLTHLHKLNTSSAVRGGCIFITIYAYHHLFYHWQHVSSKLHFVAIWSGFGMIHKHEENVHWRLIISSVCILSNLIYCSHKKNWRLFTQEPKFVIFMVVTQEPAIRNQVKQMNGVNTRTNIFHIHGCHTRTNHK